MEAAIAAAMATVERVIGVAAKHLNGLPLRLLLSSICMLAAAGAAPAGTPPQRSILVADAATEPAPTAPDHTRGCRMGGVAQPAPVRESLATLIGRWQGQSTAGMAVLEVLTITPERVRWGNAFNGRCDSTYRAEVLPNGRGSYPDNLTPPLQPTGLEYRVVRLTLTPGPCASGDAMLQLAMPLDGSDRLFVNSYDRQGQLTGWYGELNRLP